MSRRDRDSDPQCKVYVGNLGNNGDKYELEDSFSKYGPLKHVWMARNPPGFAFVEFEDKRYILVHSMRAVCFPLTSIHIYVE